MDEKQIDVSLTGIIFNISVICGCQLPVNEHHIKALEKEFLIFLNDFGYTQMTCEEILTAFRMNAACKLDEKIEVYGSIFNIDYAGKVIRQYKDKRFNLDFKLGRMYIKKERDELIEEEDNTRRRKVQEQYEKYLSDDDAILDLENCYMQLIHDDAFLDNMVYKRFSDRGDYFSESTGKYAYLSPKNSLTHYGEFMDAAFEAQRLAVKYMFLNMKKQGFKKVYNEEMKLIHKHFYIPEDAILPKENVVISPMAEYFNNTHF